MNPAPGRSAPAAVDWPAWPVYGLADDLLPTLAAWARTADRRADHPIALATLVGIVGTSPRPLGSEMAIHPDGRVVGYVSGGCVEGAVAAEAADVIATGRVKQLDYGAGSPVLDVQLACGGRIGLLVRRIDDLGTYVAERQALHAARRDIFIDIDLASGSERLVEPDTPAAAAVFRQHYPPPSRLVLVGSDPITVAAAQLADHMGLEVGLIRPYGPSAPPPGSRLAFYDTRALSAALADLVIDAHTALYSLTHDMEDDEAVLLHGLASEAFSLGVLGSRRKAEERRQRLAALGVDQGALARISMPAGLDIAARNPREIALSIVAGVIADRPRPRMLGPA